jgi:xanthine/CO dehydrogenase XdhC/CoxF family maturation factor
VNTEWLLVRADEWIFPTIAGDCCDTGVIEWSISDLVSGDTPKYGKQGTTTGPGVFTTPSTGGLQTHTFVPEPSAVILSVFAFGATLLRRKRNS